MFESTDCTLPFVHHLYNTTALSRRRTLRRPLTGDPISRSKQDASPYINYLPGESYDTHLYKYIQQRRVLLPAFDISPDSPANAQNLCPELWRRRPKPDNTITHQDYPKVAVVMRLRHVLAQYCHACTTGLSAWSLLLAAHAHQ